MKGLLLRWLLSGLSLLLVSYLVPGIRVDSFFYALLAAAFLGILNAIVRPLLIILTLPLTVLTLGLFLFVINAFMLMILSAVIKGVHVGGFWPALGGALILSVIGWLTSSFINDRGRIEYRDLRKGSDGKWS
ncbi:MAG: phage holin family protein [Proteobacteria bacterium]|nr:phage holin family protein [Pseudomonadota bacterium]